MFCKQCGSPLTPETKFCKQCGTPVPTHLPDQPAQHTKQKGSKKKTVIAVIAIVLVLAIIGTVLAVMVFRNSHDIHSAYLDLIEQYEDEYGSCREYEDTLNGLCFADLIDFNNDSMDELLLCFREPKNDAFQYDVYSFDGKKAQKIYSDVANTASQWLQLATDTLQTVTRNGKTYIEKITQQTKDETQWERREYIGYTNDDTLEVQVMLEKDPVQNQYRVDGDDVTQEDYKQQLDQFVPQQTVDLSQDNQDQLIKDTQAVKDQLKDKKDSDSQTPTPSVPNETATQPTDQTHQPTVMASAADRFGSVVSSGNGIYYWKYTAASLNSEALFGSYSAQPNVTNQLICRTGETETVVTQANGAGQLAVAGDRIFYQTVAEELYSCLPDGSDVLSHGQGTIKGVTDDNQWVIINDSSTLITLSATDFSRTILSNEANFKLCHENKIYYQPIEHSDAAILGKCILCVTNPDGTENKTLYTTSSDLYDFASGSNCSIYHPYVQNGFIYFSYGRIDGTGNFFQGGRIAKVDINGGGGEIVAGQPDLVDEYFLVDQTGNVTTSNYDSELYGLAMDKYMTSAGKAIIYNPETQKAETVIAPADYASLTELPLGSGEDHCVLLSYMEMIGNKVYYSIHLGKHRPEGDLGWRYNYERQTTVLFEKDLTTGTVNELNRF